VWVYRTRYVQEPENTRDLVPYHIYIVIIVLHIKIFGQKSADIRASVDTADTADSRISEGSKGRLAELTAASLVSPVLTNKNP
jgi:hypothetical protein